MNKVQIFEVFTTFADVETHAHHVWKKESVPRHLKCKKVNLHSLTHKTTW